MDHLDRQSCLGLSERPLPVFGVGLHAVDRLHRPTSFVGQPLTAREVFNACGNADNSIKFSVLLLTPDCYFRQSL